jgi:RNA polymerase sigma factor (sigma-70 family)
MATSQMSEVVQYLRRAVLVRDGSDLTDGQLLERFRARRDESAFRALVRRHGPMVLGVCRRVLRHEHDAEDAFQATFLVLVRKAAALAAPELLGPWLHGVAHRTALKARAAALRRHGREKQVLALPEPEAAAPERRSELLPLLDEELSRLPDKYRATIVLCDLEAHTRQEAARRLGVPEGTVAGRLARARALLAKRLGRHGVVLSAGALAALLAPRTASAALVAATVHVAGLFSAESATAAGLIPARVVALMEGVSKPMILSKLKLATLGLFLLGLPGLGTDTSLPRVRAEKADARAAADRPPAPEPQPPSLNGGVAAVSADGKTVTLTIAALERGAEPRRLDLRLTDKTEITYFGVRPNGARPTEGYAATVWLQAGSSDIAARVRFSYSDTPRGGIRGQVAAVSADGKVITLEIPVNRDPNGEKKRFEYKLSEQTRIEYQYIPKNAAKPMAGYHAEIWLDEGTRDNFIAGLVARVVFIDFARSRNAEVNGKLAAISRDGSTLTVEIPSAERGVENKKVDLKLTIETDISYHGVGPGGAMLTEGLHVHAWRVDGTSDTAAKIILTKPGERGR